jgi:tetratricopeptide (TPR) repeat protein
MRLPHRPPAGAALIGALVPALLACAPLATAAHAQPATPATAADAAAIDSLVWLGRRVAYLGLVPEAVAVYTRALARFPGEPHLLRHRGHRWISLRDWPRAIDDLSRAAAALEGRPDEVEPDGQPNAAGIPVSTLHFNVWYHLGLAHWLAGDAVAAAAAFERCLAVSRNDDSRVAARYWLWQIYRRLGRADEAAATAAAARTETQLLENEAYARLLTLFDGRATPDDVRPPSDAPPLARATIGYGIGAWHRAHGRFADARAAWDQVLRDAGGAAAFGALAAEEERRRLP